MDINEVKRILSNLVDMNDLLNELHKKQYGEDSPYKIDEKDRALFDKVLKSGDKNHEQTK